MTRRLERVVADDARMMALWDAAANDDIDPGTLGMRSSRRRFWRCPVADDHRWPAPPSSISKSLEKGFTGCPCCAGRKLSVTNSFAARYPHGIPLWHARNALGPDQVLAGSPEPVWWKCSAGPDHEWQAAPLVVGSHSLAKGRRGCPFCSGHRASVTNNLTNHPQLLAEWHPTRNAEAPEDVVAGTGKKLWWRCLENTDHEWQATGANRLRGQGCPRCRKLPRSVLEVGIAYELQTLFPELDLADDKVVLDGVVRHVDLLLPDLNIVIEVDGRYRHDGQVEHDRDVFKTQLLTEAGYRVLRVRERPLRPITAADVVVPRDTTVKQATDALLGRLRHLGWCDVPGLDEYLSELGERRLDAALEHVRRERPGKQVRAPGPAAFTRSQRWEDGLAVLRAFVDREGHANVPWEHVEDEFPLGKWVGSKRAQQKRGRMRPDRAEVLADLPGWTWDAVGDQWEVGYRRLLEYREREGHINVPTHYWDADGFPLGSWVRSHRRPGGGRRTMTPEQQTRLEAVPGWTYDAVKDAFWERAFTAFETFAHREGHTRTPRQHLEDGINIDAWSKLQRARFHRGDLAEDRAQRLEAVPGWSWSPQDDAWEQGFSILESHVEATGSANVRRDELRDDYPLGAWVGEQRNRNNRGQLDPRRRDRLEALRGWSWDPHGESWERHFEALLTFVAREGHARVPTDHVEAGLPLASWVIRHRHEHKAGNVTADRVRRLEELPGWTWDVLAARWEAHFVVLQRFTDRYGHARVPTDHVEDGLKLGQWVIAQRQGHRLGQVSAVRTARLAALPGWVWDMRDIAWDTGFDALQQYQRRTGHCHVPKSWMEDGYRLGQWLGVQRGLLRAGRLREDRVRRLTALTGWSSGEQEALPFL